MRIGRYLSWIAFVATGFAVVLLLSRLPAAEQNLNHRLSSVSVFEPESAARLTDDRLVDALSAIPLSNRPIRLEWNHGILAVDLRGEEPRLLNRDIALLLGFAYSDVRNVKQVLIRAFESRGERKVLLLAAETRKTDWTEEELALLRQSADNPGSELAGRSTNIRWTITAAGKRWFGNFANS
ncbi:hypothetical protein J4772_10880 [Cohnella sp. LGH]|uniref:hypothetical protein n=1 Tax=Cohnella sp. LGH TaxID=1619153 RepID=UPI001ADD5069|nr:hypothetical protein [Cohnella sp. LGH]QTH44851.1 hypothetical protein J4772_10880 [Cohnella sp. LGH]